MKTTFNFYLLYEDMEDNYEELLTGVENENLIYLTLQIGDYIVIPNNQEAEFVITKIIKNLSKQEIDVYVSKIKGPEELFDELESFASKTLQTMFDSIKANIDELGKDKDEDDKVTYLKEIKYEEMKDDN